MTRQTIIGDGNNTWYLVREYVKKIFVYIFILAILSIGSVFALLFFGIVWFNNPSRNDYPVQGIDVSNHQGKINWKLVKDDRVDFAYIKATEGGDFVDNSFVFNWNEARKHNITIGAYHFFTLCKSGEEQAKNYIDIVPVTDGSLPPANTLEIAKTFLATLILTKNLKIILKSLKVITIDIP